MADDRPVVTIRRGVVADAAALAGLAERTFYDTFAAENSAADMDAYAAQTYSTERQGRELADPDVVTLVAADRDEALVALAQLRSGSAPPCVVGPRPLELWRFYVDRQHHGRGVAQVLMDAALECARARAAGTLWLGVWERNVRAQAFYRKAGFVDVGTHTFMLGSDAQTDRVMARPVGEWRSDAMNRLFWQALFAFLLLPGTVAFAVPLLLLAPGWSGSFVDSWGLIPLVIGIGLLLWCVREFYVAGRGTLAPWTPPKELVVTGVYRFSRNPMYLAVLLILSGWALGFRSRSLAIYALAIMAAFQLRIVFGEEPWLARTHGDEWIRYKAQVPRWFW